MFIESNVNGTYNLLQAVAEGLSGERREAFQMHHISTDEVFGSLGAEGRFSETTPYDPRSPYSASKAASDHLVQAWHHTFVARGADQLLQQLRTLQFQKTHPRGHLEGVEVNVPARRWTM